MSNQLTSRSPVKNGPILAARPPPETRTVTLSHGRNRKGNQKGGDPTMVKRRGPTIEDARRGGRARSPRKTAACRIAAWRNGRRAKEVALQEVVAQTIRQVPGAREAIESLVRERLPGLDEGKLREAVERVEAEIVHSLHFRKLLKEGLILVKRGNHRANARLELLTPRLTARAATWLRGVRRDDEHDPKGR
jgi:hypothetical protein